VQSGPLPCSAAGLKLSIEPVSDALSRAALASSSSALASLAASGPSVWQLASFPMPCVCVAMLALIPVRYAAPPRACAAVPLNAARLAAALSGVSRSRAAEGSSSTSLNSLASSSCASRQALAWRDNADDGCDEEGGLSADMEAPRLFGVVRALAVVSQVVLGAGSGHVA